MSCTKDDLSILFYHLEKDLLLVLRSLHAAKMKDERWARQLLGIAPTERLVQRSVARRYRALALELHPDRCLHHGGLATAPGSSSGGGGSPSSPSAAGFHAVHEAYEVLCAACAATANGGAGGGRRSSAASSRAEEFTRMWAEQAAAMRAAATAQWAGQRRTATAPSAAASASAVPPSPSASSPRDSIGGRRAKSHAFGMQAVPPPPATSPVPPPPHPHAFPRPVTPGRPAPHGGGPRLMRPAMQQRDAQAVAVALRGVAMAEMVGRGGVMREEALAGLGLVKVFCTL